jgi:hypothetical protein
MAPCRLCWWPTDSEAIAPAPVQGCLKDDHEVLEAIATLPSASIPSMS